MTKYIDIQSISNDIDYNNLIKKVGNSILNGELVIFPTDTVYGIGTNAFNSSAVKKIYSVKNRSLDNPINLLVNNIDMIKSITTNITKLEYRLIETFLPGAFSIILPKNNLIPNIVTANSNFVGIRIPNNKIALDLINSTNKPIATTSANISGKISSTYVTDIINEFNQNTSYILDNGISDIGLESTIVQVINNSVHILRLGSILPEDIKKITPNNVILKTDNIPSNNLVHYETNSNNTVIYSKDNIEMVNKIYTLSISKASSAILCSDENVDLYTNLLSKHTNVEIFSYGTKNNLNLISKNLFHRLYEINKKSFNNIFIEGFEKAGLGITLMDKLLNISKGNYIEL